MKYFLTAFIVVLFVTAEMFACNMFKITKNKSTFVGNNEDWWSPMTQIWFEPKQMPSMDIWLLNFTTNLLKVLLMRVD